MARRVLSLLRPVAAPFLHRFEWRVASGVRRSGIEDRISSTLIAMQDRVLADTQAQVSARHAALVDIQAQVSAGHATLAALAQDIALLRNGLDVLRDMSGMVELRLDALALGQLRSSAFAAAMRDLRDDLQRAIEPEKRHTASSADVSSPRRAVVVGAGGHAKVVLEAMWAMGGFEIVGLVDPDPAAPSVLGMPVLGGDEKLEEMHTQGVTDAVVALGSNRTRERIGDKLHSLGYRLPPIVHPNAHVSPTARLGKGAVIMAGAVVGTLAEVGDYAIVNTGAVVDHDNRLGRAAHVAPGTTLAGNVIVGDRALVGAGAAARPGVRIGADAVVGAASAVVADVADGAVVGGAPARPLRRAPE
jgi:UDP-perosamine 4-acetyltransferase